MKIEIAVALMMILCAITCWAAWRVYCMAEWLRPIINAVELVRSIPFID